MFNLNQIMGSYFLTYKLQLEQYIDLYVCLVCYFPELLRFFYSFHTHVSSLVIFATLIKSHQSVQNFGICILTLIFFIPIIYITLGDFLTITIYTHRIFVQPKLCFEHNTHVHLNVQNIYTYRIPLRMISTEIQYWRKLFYPKINHLKLDWEESTNKHSFYPHLKYKNCFFREKNSVHQLVKL